MSRKSQFFQTRLRAVLLALIMLCPVLGRALDLQLGKYTFAYPPATSLAIMTPLSIGVGSYGFCSQVGGVAFGGMAAGQDGLKVVSLQYVVDRPDGQRLRVTLQDTDGIQHIVTAPIYDWQLVPIAKFANSNQDACFTLFGNLRDKADAEARRRCGEKILNYNPVFADTLLGLRLFQSDIVLLYPEAGNLPSDNGTILLGAGENKSDVAANNEALANVHSKMEKWPDHPFRSYVICDYGVKVTFSTSEDQLKLTGNPVWFCWKNTTDDPAEQKRIYAEINQKGNEAARRQLQTRYDQDKKRLSVEDFNRKYTQEYQQKVYKAAFDKAVGPIAEKSLSDILLKKMPDYTAQLSAEIQSQGGINATVYEVLVTTMRYAALFRHAKQLHPLAYKAFMDSLAHVSVQPAVRTPTVLIPSAGE